MTNLENFKDEENKDVVNENGTTTDTVEEVVEKAEEADDTDESIEVEPIDEINEQDDEEENSTDEDTKVEEDDTKIIDELISEDTTDKEEDDDDIDEVVEKLTKEDELDLEKILVSDDILSLIKNSVDTKSAFYNTSETETVKHKFKSGKVFEIKCPTVLDLKNLRMGLQNANVGNKITNDENVYRIFYNLLANKSDYKSVLDLLGDMSYKSTNDIFVTLFKSIYMNERIVLNMTCESCNEKFNTFHKFDEFIKDFDESARTYSVTDNAKEELMIKLDNNIILHMTSPSILTRDVVLPYMAERKLNPTTQKYEESNFGKLLKIHANILEDALFIKDIYKLEDDGSIVKIVIKDAHKLDGAKDNLNNRAKAFSFHLSNYNTLLKSSDFTNRDFYKVELAIKKLLSDYGTETVRMPDHKCEHCGHVHKEEKLTEPAELLFLGIAI